MLIRKVILVGLTIAVLIITGCIPHALPEPTATARPTETVTATLAPTKTPTETRTPMPEPEPVLGPIPADNSAEKQFEGYQEADFTAAVENFQSWWEKWIQAGMISADAVGGTVESVPLKGGGVCGLILSGSYYEEGKDTYLCIPLNTVDGGLRGLPSGDIAKSDIDNYPLFIKLDKGQKLELVGGVYQMRNTDNSPAWYVNPVDNDKGKAGAKIDGEYKAPSYTVTRLSAELMLADHGVEGTGMEIKGSYEGVSLDVTIILSKTLDNENGPRVCNLNSDMGKVDPTLPAEIRTLKIPIIGIYMRTVREMGATEDSFPFDLFIKQLAGGKDFSTLLYGKGLDGSVEKFPVKISRSKPIRVEFVAIGPGSARYGDDITKTKAFLINGYAYQQLADGGFRIVSSMDGSYNNADFCMVLGMNYGAWFGVMGSRIEELEGNSMLYGLPLAQFPKTINMLNNTGAQPHTKYGNLGIFRQP